MAACGSDHDAARAKCSRVVTGSYAQEAVGKDGTLDRPLCPAWQSFVQDAANDFSEPIVLNAALGAKVRFVSRRLC